MMVLRECAGSTSAQLSHKTERIKELKNGQSLNGPNRYIFLDTTRKYSLGDGHGKARLVIGIQSVEL